MQEMQETQIGEIPGRRKWQPTPVFWPGESHGQRSLGGYSPGVCKELAMTACSHTPTAQTLLPSGFLAEDRAAQERHTWAGARLALLVPTVLQDLQFCESVFCYCSWRHPLCLAVHLACTLTLFSILFHLIKNIVIVSLTNFGLVALSGSMWDLRPLLDIWDLYLSMWDLVPWPGIKPGLHWDWGVPATGPPGKSLLSILEIVSRLSA